MPARRDLGALLLLLSGVVAGGCHQGGGGEPLPTALEIAPTGPAVAHGTSTNLFAVVRYRDGSLREATSDVEWSCADTDIAALALTSTGLTVTGMAPGTTTITAREPATRIAATIAFRVTDAVLVSLEVTPTNPAIALGTGQQFAATGIFSDQSTQDLTTQVSWQTSNLAIATIDGGGMATGAGLGVTVVTATHAATGISGATNLQVTAAVLVAIEITPTLPSIALGTTRQFTATGTYSDSSTRDLTSTAAWASSTTAVAAVGNGMTAGLATATGLGTSIVTATDTATAIDGATAITVTPAELVTIAVTPALPSIALGTTRQFTATGTFTDSTVQDLTTAVSWSSSQTSVATITNLSGSEGLASAVATGTTTITALHPSTSVQGTTTLTVTPAVLLSIAVTPNPADVMTGSTRQLSATG
ncbi:MAG: Ig-like domain-containing protein, partial [Planctomycetes bacterium]|nr:Ig-like domain-containing protein [Planctomycetota bacterium]